VLVVHRHQVVGPLLGDEQELLPVQGFYCYNYNLYMPLEELAF
jgi:hypothetical protein